VCRVSHLFQACYVRYGATTLGQAIVRAWAQAHTKHDSVAHPGGKPPNLEILDLSRPSQPLPSSSLSSKRNAVGMRCSCGLGMARMPRCFLPQLHTTRRRVILPRYKAVRKKPSPLAAERSWNRVGRRFLLSSHQCRFRTTSDPAGGTQPKWKQLHLVSRYIT
jgi:hypothetical protein